MDDQWWSWITPDPSWSNTWEYGEIWAVCFLALGTCRRWRMRTTFVSSWMILGRSDWWKPFCALVPWWRPCNILDLESTGSGRHRDWCVMMWCTVSRSFGGEHLANFWAKTIASCRLRRPIAHRLKQSGLVLWLGLGSSSIIKFLLKKWPDSHQKTAIQTIRWSAEDIQPNAHTPACPSLPRCSFDKTCSCSSGPATRDTRVQWVVE